MGLSAPSTGEAGRSLPPHPRLRSVRALFTGRPRMWGHSSRCFTFGGVSPCIILGQPGSDCIRTSAIIGVQHPLAGQSPASLPAQPRFARVLHANRPFAAGIEPMVANSGMQLHGARVAPSTGISLRSLPFMKRKIRKRPDASSDYWIGSPAGIPGGRAASRF